MSKISNRKALITVVCCLIIWFISAGCGLEREYYDDIHIQLETHNAEIIIREWSFLMGSGAEIYCKNGDEKILLGQTPGGDDGFCSFKEGLYTIEVKDNKLTIEWCRFPANKEKPWEKETFELPAN